MTLQDVLRSRLRNQQITSGRFKKPEELVPWLGAVQSQDYASAKWALGVRLGDITDAAVEKSFNDGRILRTHVLRPTWHFVSPADIRWLLALTAPRVKAQSAPNYLRAGLDQDTFKNSENVLVKALEGGKHLTRLEMVGDLKKHGIVKNSLQYLHIFGQAELDGLICSGPVAASSLPGPAFLEERVPHAKALTREESVTEITGRYFTGHGQATVRDLAWWSGLSTSEIKAGIDSNADRLGDETVDGQRYWFSAGSPISGEITRDAYLLPAFDEYMVGYTDRRGLIDPLEAKKLAGQGVYLLNASVIIDGRMVATWKRKPDKGSFVIEVKPATDLNTSQKTRIEDSAGRYAKFLGSGVGLVFK